MSGRLESIVALQKTLDELGEAKSRLENIPDWMQELHEEHSTRKAEIDAVVETKETAARERRTAEAELEDAQAKLKHYQEQISQVSTQREYGALLKEIDTVKSQSNDYEQQALEALEKHETAESQLKELEESFRELDERYHAELAKWDAEKPGVAERAGELETRAAELRAEVPQGLLRLFDRLFDRYSGAALAQVRKAEAAHAKGAVDHCSACNYRVRPQSVVQIREQGALVQCDNCKRILYFEEEAAEAA